MFQSFTDYKPIIVVSSRNFHADLSCFVFPLSPGRLYIFSDDITIIGDAHVYVCVCVSGGSGQMANRFFSISSCTCRSEDKIKKKKLKTKPVVMPSYSEACIRSIMFFTEPNGKKMLYSCILIAETGSMLFLN